MPTSAELEEAAKRASNQSVMVRPPPGPSEQETVATPHEDYVAMAEMWHPIDTLLGGTRAMRAAGKTYLPMEPKEETDEYKARINRSTLFNATKRTVSNLVGRIFHKPITLGDDVPAPLKVFSENVDRHRNHINTFARQLLWDAIPHGLTHVFVDMPKNKPGATLADERDQKIEPYFVHVKAENLIGWRYDIVNGEAVLSQIRMKEYATVPNGRYGQKSICRIRVVNRDFYEIWEPDSEKQGEWKMVDDGPMTLGVIPLATIYTGYKRPLYAEPPLSDLADVNIQHWQSASDQRNILHVARVPFLFGSGLADATGEIVVSANRLIKGPQNSDLKYVEHTGSSIEAGRQDLIDLEDQMRILGMELLMPRTGNETATGRAIDASESRSELQNFSQNLGDGLENAFAFAAKWRGIGDDGGSITPYQDFGITLRDATDAQTIVGMMASGALSRRTGWEELKRRGLLADDFDPEAEETLLEGQGPVGGEDDDKGPPRKEDDKE